MLGESVRRRQPQRPRPGRRPRWQIWLAGVLLALALPFALGYALAVFVLFPEPDIAAAGIPVPVLVGRDAGEAERALAAAGLGTLDVTSLPHPNARVGLVLAQSPLPGQQLPRGGDVRVSVSGGRPRVRIPDVTGFSAERARQMLERVGFDVVEREQEGTAPAGRVLGTDLLPGGEAELPASITLLVSTGPPPEILPPDTGFDAPPG